MKKIIETLKKDKQIISVFLFAVFLLVLLSVPILITQVRNFNLSQNKIMYSSKVQKYVSDKAKLKANDVFTNNTDGYYSSEFYVSSLIDEIKISYNASLYTYSNDNDLKFIGTVTSKLIIESSEGQILEKTYGEQTSSYISQFNIPAKNQDNVSLNTEVSLDYDRYITDFKAIETALSGVPITGKIKVQYNIRTSPSYNSVINGEEFSYNDTLTSYIPVQTTGTLDIIHNYTTKTSLEKSDTVFYNKVNYVWLTFAVLCDVVAIGISSLLVMAFIEKKNENAKMRFINKILQNNNDIIVNCVEIPKIKYPIVKLQTFDDIIKAEVELSSPINFVKNGDLYEFYVYGNNLVYYYSYLTKEEPVDENMQLEIDKKLLK